MGPVHAHNYIFGNHPIMLDEMLLEIVLTETILCQKVMAAGLPMVDEPEDIITNRSFSEEYKTLNPKNNEVT